MVSSLKSNERNGPPLIVAEDLGKVFHSRNAPLSGLRGVNIEVPSGALAVITGPTGSGKSALLLILGGMLRPDQGAVRIDGHDLYQYTERERAELRAASIGFLPETPSLVPHLSVLENTLAACRRAAARERGPRARGVLAALGLAGLMDQRVGQLGAEEQQRVALARALVNGPRVLLADEPLGPLCDSGGEELLRHLEAFARKGGAVLMTTRHASLPEATGPAYSMDNGLLHVLSPDHARRNAGGGGREPRRA